MTTSLERSLAVDLAECLELDAACRRVFQAAAALRTDNKRSVLAVKRTVRDLKLLMDDKLHSLDIESVIDGFGDEAETRTAGSALVLLSECLRTKHHELSAVFYRSRCRDCNIHDRMSFASVLARRLLPWCTERSN
jgi:hypothetical protein